MLRRFLLLCLPLVLLFAVSSATHARMLHQSTRIALYSDKAESGNRNSHPITLEADQLSAALSRVRARSGDTGEVIDLFPEKNREESAVQLVKELRGIDPDQELHLVSFRKVGAFFSGQRNASAARVFMENGRLNLIFGQIDLFFSEFRDPDRPVPPMGSRKQAVSLKGSIIPAEGVTFVDGRNDWVALDMVPSAPSPPAVVPAAKGAGQEPGGKSPMDAVRPKEKSIEEKLQILKNLKDKDLITEQEYVDKKREIIDSL
ncbi:MAG: SHOCT domain-containing protein [Pseudomonadota bacterium]